MSKKKVTMMVLLFVVIVLAMLIIYLCINKGSDSIRFKKEYESLNAQEKYIDVKIPEDNNVQYASFDDVMDVLNSGTGIIYFGFPECPWCRNALPVLLKAAKDNEVSNFYYYNAKSIRDEKVLKDGKVVTNKKGTDEYYKLLDKLSDVISPYQGLNDDSIKRLYFPTAVFVMGGKIVGFHEGTVDSQEDPSKNLTSKQEKELLNIYNENIEKIYGFCDTEKSC